MRYLYLSLRPIKAHTCYQALKPTTDPLGLPKAANSGVSGRAHSQPAAAPTKIGAVEMKRAGSWQDRHRMDNIDAAAARFFPLLSCGASPPVWDLLHLKVRILISLSSIDLLET